MTTTIAVEDKQVQIKVMIVGAGLAGLMLAILLEKLGIDYEIFERSSEVRPLGSALTIGPNMLPVFEQLGIFDELMRISLPMYSMDIYNEDMSMIGMVEFKAFEDVGGYHGYAFSRPDFHNLLFSKVPAERIHYGKKVLSILQGDKGVMIRTADGQSHEGDLLVGADGGHSAVRQRLYEKMAKDGKLPRLDGMKLDLGYSCMVGTTGELDPEIYPGVNDGQAHFSSVLANGAPHSWRTFMVPGNRVCWSVSIQVTTEEEKEQVKRNSKWGPAAVEEMVKLVAHHKVPLGGTLGDLINATPKEFISKVYLEEKLFETWYHDRTVLIGDACHKMMPSAGQGATNAMQDSVILANCLFDLRSNSIEHITEAMKSYKEQRYPHAKNQFEISQKLGKMMYGHKLTERLIRHVVLNWLPKSVLQKGNLKTYRYKPQVIFMPLVPHRGIVPAEPQVESRRLKATRMSMQETTPKEV
ncbi:hypothetical protein BGZ83_005912 [Gryganskiella cystojenkinii]|nr:hypothetical protein BGZ83_005912 [Gryganskiella cystojenkinii]